MQHFDAILSDPEGARNLNALANKMHLCKILHRSGEATRCKEQLASALNENEMSKIERARCFAEQGYAFANDIHGEYVTHQRFTNALDCYTKALENCKDVVSKEERLDWVLGKARALHKICRTKHKTQNLFEGEGFMKQFIDHIAEVIPNGDADDDMKEESWMFIGQVLGRNRYISQRGSDVRDDFSTELKSFVPEWMRQYVDHPVACFDKALQINQQSSHVLVSKARHVRHDSLDYALQLLEESIELDRSEFNRGAFALRGELFLSRYKKMKNGKDISDLLQAKVDFEDALQMHKGPTEFRKLGEVWQFLADQETDSTLVVKHVQQTRLECLEMALQCYTRGADTQDGEKNPLLQIKRGECLYEMEEYEAAAESFQKAIEYSNPSNKNGATNYAHLLGAHIAMINKDTSYTNAIIQETISWLHRGIKTYGDNEIAASCFFNKKYVSPLQLQHFLQLLENVRNISYVSCIVAFVKSHCL